MTNEWIKHDGNGIPVSGNVKIEVRFRCDEDQYGYSDEFEWDHADDDGDIVAYRVLA